MEFEEGELMIISSPNFFKGNKLAAYLKPCKIHEGGHELYLTNTTSITKRVCVTPGEPGNTIKRLSDLVDTTL